MPTSNNTNRSLSKQDELLITQVQYFVKLEDLKLTKKQKFKRFIWDPETKKFLGRTGSSWSKIGLFYLIFYGMLAALVAICMWIFFQTLDPRIPKWQLDRSIIGTNPGLGFRPMPSSETESTLIWFQGSNRTSYLKWIDNLMGFLDQYYTPGKTEKGTVTIKRCSYTEPPQRGQVCDFDVRLWKDCSPEHYFNYHKSAPCIFLKLNKIYGWIPEYYNDTNDLPANMPESLQRHIKLSKPEELNTVWISCAGESPADVEYLGPVVYFPEIRGFPGYYYPYENSEGYLSPLVAVQFKRPTRRFVANGLDKVVARKLFSAGILINIECKAWAKNIKHNRQERAGSVHFELLID